MYGRADFRLNLKDDSPAAVAEPLYRVWDQFVAERNAAADGYDFGDSSPPIVAQSSTGWVRLFMELEAVRGAVEAWVISNGCAFLGIFLFTQNILVALYTTVSIMGIVVVLAGYMVMYEKWEFGAIEAISITIFVGFSVDYCLHLAHAYNSSVHRNRFLKVSPAPRG